MRKRSAQFKYGRHTGDYSQFKSARNKFVAEKHQAKKNYFAKLNPRDQKGFLENCKKLNKSPCSILTLFHNGVSAREDMDKANLLNAFFSTCFNTSHPPLSVDSPKAGSNSPEYPDELLCTNKEVEHLLPNLDISKASALMASLQKC